MPVPWLWLVKTVISDVYVSRTRLLREESEFRVQQLGLSIADWE